MRIVNAHLCMNFMRKPMILHDCVCMEGCVSVLVWVVCACASVEGRCWYQMPFLGHSPPWYILFSFSFLTESEAHQLRRLVEQWASRICHYHSECYMFPPLCPDLYISSMHTNSHSHVCTVSILPNEPLLQPWYEQIFDVKTELSHHLAFLLLCALPKELKSVCKNMSIPLLVSTLFMVAKKWRQLNCLLVDGFIKNFGICTPQDTI